MIRTVARTLCFLVIFCLFAASVNSVAMGAEPVVLSHPNLRPLPVGHDRPLPGSGLIYVDAGKGDDANPGTIDKPLKRAQAGVNKAQPGETVVLRGGTYYEQVKITKAGTPEKPITLRAYPNELVAIDAGFEEFYNDPKGAWEPVKDGAKGEYRSTRTYEMEPWTLSANFGDTMLPLIVYRFMKDLRSTQEYWTITDKSDKAGEDQNVYCGPGVFYNPEDKRIHIRMAPTTLTMVGKDNYSGVSDPRQISLIVGSKSAAAPVTVVSSAHVNVQDIVMRGGGKCAATIDSSYDVEFNGCTLYAGNSALNISFTNKVRILHTAIRGACSPWNFRGQMKYRSREARVISASGWNTGGVEDLEIGYCELTDSIDGTFIGGVKRASLHNSRIDNFTDDCIFISANTTPDGTTQGGGLEIYENLISRSLTVFAFGVGHGRQLTLDEEKKVKQVGSGVFIYRNIFDFRTAVHYNMPKDAQMDSSLDEHGRLFGDHGSPTWEPIAFYQNTVLYGENEGRNLFTFNQAMGGGTKRRVFNNALVFAKGLPGTVVTKPIGDLQTDANLTWSLDSAWKGEDPYARFKASKDYALTRDYYPPGWMANDVIKDPAFTQLSDAPGSAFNLTPKSGSPAIGAGLKLPEGLPDPLKPADGKRPDIGAVQTGKPVWRLGVGGRFDAFGAQVPGGGVAWNQGRVQPVAKPANWSNVLARKPIGIVNGYPNVDRPQLVHFLKSNHVQIAFDERGWPKPEQLGDYGVLAVVDSPRGMFAPTELEKPIKDFVDQGGTLLVMSGATEAFKQMPKLLPSIAGDKPAAKTPPVPSLLVPGHPWTKQLEAMEPKDWRPERQVPLPVAKGKGEVIIGTKDGQALLAVVPSGKGQLIYVGWAVTADRPTAGSRNEWANTPKAEAESQAQVDILKHIVNTLYPDPVEIESASPGPVMGRLTGE
jgi:hypothetical protein